MSNAITLQDISRVGSEAHWPSIAAEVHGYLAAWVEAANAQVSNQQLEIRRAPISEPTDEQGCGWLLAAHLNATTPAGSPVVTLLESHIKAITIEQRVGFPEPKEQLVGVQASNEPPDYMPRGWIYPTWEMMTSSGSWNRPPTWHYPFNGLVAWSLTAGEEFFFFVYNQHNYTDRRAMPLFIAREQTSGYWLMAASIGTTWRSVCWSQRANLPAGGVRLLTVNTGFYIYTAPSSGGTPALQLRQPAEVAVSDTNWNDHLYVEGRPQATIPVAHFDPVLLPPAFATCTAAHCLATLEDGHGDLWLGLGNNLVLKIGP